MITYISFSNLFQRLFNYMLHPDHGLIPMPVLAIDWFVKIIEPYMTIFFFIFYFSFIFISWRLITSQHFSGFCHILTWISHGVIYIPHKSSFSFQTILESSIISILQCKEVYSKDVISLMVLLGKWEWGCSQSNLGQD